MVMFIVHCILIYICVYQSLNQLKFINASYDTYCEEYLLKPKFYKIIQLCMIHRSIYDLV